MYENDRVFKFICDPDHNGPFNPGTVAVKNQDKTVRSIPAHGKGAMTVSPLYMSQADQGHITFHRLLTFLIHDTIVELFVDTDIFDEPVFF